MEKSAIEALSIFEKRVKLTKDQHDLLKLLIERAFVQGKLSGAIEIINISK